MNAEGSGPSQGRRLRFRLGIIGRSLFIVHRSSFTTWPTSGYGKAVQATKAGA